MKKYVLSAIILSFAFLISTERANAQAGRQIRVAIPFEFSVGGKTFEAGNYVLVGISNLSGANAFQLIDGNNNSRLAFTTMPLVSNLTSKNNKVSLYFRRYGNRHFLAGISDPATSLNVEIRKSKNEILVAKNFKKNKSESGSVTLNGGID